MVSVFSYQRWKDQTLAPGGPMCASAMMPNFNLDLPEALLLGYEYELAGGPAALEILMGELGVR